GDCGGASFELHGHVHQKHDADDHTDEGCDYRHRGLVKPGETWKKQLCLFVRHGLLAPFALVLSNIGHLTHDATIITAILPGPSRALGLLFQTMKSRRSRRRKSGRS